MTNQNWQISNLEYRNLGKPGYCRLCRKDIEPNVEQVICFYNPAGRGNMVFLCDTCVDLIYDLKNES